MEFRHTPVSFLATCDQMFLLFFAALIGAGLTAVLLSLPFLFVVPNLEVKAFLGVGSFAIFIGICFGGVFWDRNLKLFRRRGKGRKQE